MYTVLYRLLLLRLLLQLAIAAAALASSSSLSSRVHSHHRYCSNLSSETNKTNGILLLSQSGTQTCINRRLSTDYKRPLAEPPAAYITSL